MLEDYKGCLFNHKRLVINAVGLVNSLRNKRDGTTFFGLFLTKKGKIMNDFILNGKIQCKSKSVFNISFDRILQSYCFKSFYDKIFIKVQSNKWNPIGSLLNKKTFIQFGEDVFSIQKAEKEIKINFVSQKLNYSFPETENEITIGRNEKCKVRVNSSILSKINCTIRFNINTHFLEIIDGYKGKSSTNGTWMLCEKNIKINLDKEENFLLIDNNIIKITSSIDSERYYL